MNIRKSTADDSVDLARIAETTGLFPADQMDLMITPFLNGADDRIWLTCLNGDIPVGFCSAKTEFLTDRTWNMHALAVDPSAHRAGYGRALVRALETHLIETDQRVLVIDTSSDPSQVPACAFYKAMGYAQVGRIPEFWSPGEDKISFSKLLVSDC